MFAVIFLEQWLKEEHHITSMIGIVASVICLIIFGLNSFMIPTMAVIEKKHRIVGGAEMIILQQIITIALCIFGTMLTRFCRLSFLV